MSWRAVDEVGEITGTERVHISPQVGSADDGASDAEDSHLPLAGVPRIRATSAESEVSAGGHATGQGAIDVPLQLDVPGTVLIHDDGARSGVGRRSVGGEQLEEITAKQFAIERREDLGLPIGKNGQVHFAAIGAPSSEHDLGVVPWPQLRIA